MERNIDLMRNILLYMEQCEKPSFQDSDFKSLETDHDALIYNLEQLIGEGYIEGKSLGGHQGGRTIRISSIKLTPSGHSFLDALRDDTAWHRVKEKFSGALATVLLATLEAAVSGAVRGLTSKH
ncbi:MAG: DUF2513 domain-containing protein [Coriobacteriia bacterium]|nr:DUF2513 domain-containing protein [Coriobacteriia bacterium]